MTWPWLLIAVCSAYLLFRSGQQWRRQRLSERALPFPPPEWTPVDGGDKACAALVGLALGDALGAPRERIPVWLARLRYGTKPAFSRGIIRWMRRPGSVTDDTQLTWLVARSLVHPNESFRQSLAGWWAFRIGAGRATERAVRAIRAGRSVASTSQGNGAAMRVAPFAIRFRDDPSRMDAAVADNAAVTHPDPEAVSSALIVARLTASLLRDEPFDVASACRDLPGTDWQETLVDPEPLGPCSGWARTTVASAVRLWLDHGTDWLPALRVLYAVGGDTDTVGAIYLSWVGAKAGLSVFPTEWVVGLQGASQLAALAERLATSAARP